MWSGEVMVPFLMMGFLANGPIFVKWSCGDGAVDKDGFGEAGRCDPGIARLPDSNANLRH